MISFDPDLPWARSQDDVRACAPLPGAQAQRAVLQDRALAREAEPVIVLSRAQ